MPSDLPVIIVADGDHGEAAEVEIVAILS